MQYKDTWERWVFRKQRCALRQSAGHPLPDLNEDVTFPVYIKAYIRKYGEASYTLNIQKSDLSRGEHF